MTDAVRPAVRESMPGKLCVLRKRFALLHFLRVAQAPPQDLFFLSRDVDLHPESHPVNVLTTSPFVGLLARLPPPSVSFRLALAPLFSTTS
jgi:hypothetical protein